MRRLQLTQLVTLACSLLSGTCLNATEPDVAEHLVPSHLVKLEQLTIGLLELSASFWLHLPMSMVSAAFAGVPLATIIGVLNNCHCQLVDCVL